MFRVRLFLVALATTVLGAVPLEAQAQTGTIRGQIVDASILVPLDDVDVRVADRIVVSDADGRFVISNVPAGTYTLRLSRLGYSPVEQTVTVVAGQTTNVDIQMIAMALEVEGLVVIGYGERQQRDLTGVVQRVTEEEFNKGRIISAEQLIQAKIPGVQVIDTGEPGGGISIRIRGGTSVTSSNEPLFVIDGVPIGTDKGISAGRNPLNFLNPDDIESITVLKDASATAIYGSRGANGVVLVETKSGRAGTQVTYTGTISGSTVSGEVDILSAAQYRDVVNSLVADGRLDAGVRDALGSANTDWRDQVQRSGFGQEHSVAVSGGSDEINYRLSVGYLNQEGVVLGSETERLSLSANYSHRLLDDRLSIDAKVLGSRSNDLFQPGGVLGSATAFAPTQPIRDPNSPFGGFFEWADPLGPNNPVAELELATDEGTTYTSVGNVTGQYALPFVEGLSATVRLGYRVDKAERRSFRPSILKGEAEGGNPGSVSRSNSTLFKSLLDTYLNYERRVGLSVFDVTAGYSYEEENLDFPSFVARGLSSDLLGPDGVPSANQQETFLTVDETKLVSYFGRVNYTLRDKYLFTVSVRRDGSSKFGPNDQWGTFPSAAVAWRVSEEPFMDGFESLTDLKFRISWGKNGNNAFPSFQAFKDFLVGNPLARAQFGDEFVPTIRPSAADPNIKWEETTSWNFGLDFGLYNGRLSGSFEYYTKDTDDLIFEVPVAAGTNLSDFVTTNIGSMKNKGFEANLNALIFDGRDEGFSWDAGFNLATNSNELVRINPFGGGTEQILVGGIAGGVGSTIQVLRPGEPINSFFVYRHKRGPDGSPIYEDMNGDGNIDDNDLYEDLNGDGVINQDDRAPFESPAPSLILGHTSLMRYRNFDASFTLLAHLGNYVYNNVASNSGYFDVLRDTQAPNNLHTSVLENDFDRPQFFSDIYVEDASFLRMDNFELGYTFNRGTLTGTRFFGAIQNVFTITGYSGIDPTAGVNGIDNNIYPRSRTFIAGVNVSF